MHANLCVALCAGVQAVRISVFQGENPDALRNIFIGDFLVEGLSEVPAPNEILCRMDLDLDGIRRERRDRERWFQASVRGAFDRSSRQQR